MHSRLIVFNYVVKNSPASISQVAILAIVFAKSAQTDGGMLQIRGAKLDRNKVSFALS